MNRLQITLLILYISFQVGVVFAEQADMDLVKSRIHDAMTASPSSSTIQGYQSTLLGDGTWADIDYASVSGSHTVTHLVRLKSMSQMYVFGSMQGDAGLRTDILRAFDGWTIKDPQADNWWYNQIKFPQLLGEILILIEADVSAAQLSAGTNLIARSYYPRSYNEGFNTGANRTDLSYATMMRGLLTADALLTEEAFLSIADTISVNSPATFAEGIEPDWSYNQHGAQLYIQGYGTVYLTTIYKYAEYGAGTMFAFSNRKIRVLTDHILDGVRWFVRGDNIEPTACGRSITRSSQATTASYLDSTLTRAVTSCDGYRQGELEAFDANMDAVLAAGEAIPASAISGNRNFWFSDMMTHHRPEFSISVKTSSTRTKQPESGNNEGLKNLHLADGATFIMRTGNEYDDIWPVLNWYRIPGTTVEQDGHSLKPPNDWGVYGTSTHAGGVTDGADGAAAFDYDRLGVSAKKSWFFMDGVMMALGANVSASSAASPVYTSLDQNLLNGAVRYSEGGTTKTLSGSVTPANLEWVHHNETGYFFPVPVSSATISAANQSGSWYSINQGQSSATVNKDVFSLYLDHGSSFNGRSYAYMVAPGVTLADMSNFAVTNYVIVKNDATAQSVTDIAAGKNYANFWAAGTAGELTSDGKVSVIWKQDAEFLDVTVSDPTQSGTGIRTLTLDIPVEGVVRADAPITVEQYSPALRIKFDMRECYGRSFQARFFLQPNAFKSIKLSPVADTYVFDGNPTNNYGSSATLVCKDLITGNWTRDPMLRFDLSGVTNALAGASLSLIPVGVSAPTMHSLRPLPADSWTESSLTWSNQPAVVSGPIGYWSPIANRRVSRDVIDIVTNRASDTLDFVVSAHEHISQSYVTYASRESGTEGMRPTLDLVVPWEDSQPSVACSGASVVGVDVIALGGVLSTGRSANAWICWGENDAGTTFTGLWDNVVSVGNVYEPNPFHCVVSGLVDDVTYWYRVYVTNSNGESWSDDAISFTAPVETDYSMQITFTNFAGRGTLTNFPALLRLNTNNTFNYTGFLDGISGYDLRVWTNAALEGSELNYEIDVFNTNGESCIWVQVPELAQGTTIWASWGSWAHSTQQPYTTNGATWSANYAAVWHLGEAAGSTAALDATSNRTSCTIYDATLEQAGRINHGYLCDGDQPTDYGPVNASYGIASLNVTAMTISGWFNDEVPGERRGYISKGKTATSAGYYNWDIYSDTDGTIGFSAVDEDDPTNEENWRISGGTSGGGWRYISATWSGTTEADGVKLYVDGVEVASGTAAYATLENDRNLSLGSQSRGAADSTFKGTMDEIRIASTPHSSNWIWACWMNQGTGHTAFVSYGAPDTGGTTTANHSVPHSWLDSHSLVSGFDYEAAVTNDSDGDTYSNWEEYWSGTNPTNENSYLRIGSVRLADGKVLIEWRHEAIASGIPPIVIQESSNLNESVWTTVAEQVPINGINSWSNASSHAIYYRLAVTNSP
jgi:chondroitin AC lyase